MNPHILIIGSGSAGKRHARNLAGLGCKISAFDPREDRLKEINEETPCIHQSQSLEEILEKETFDGAVIASPPVFHIEQGIALLGKGIPVLMEKPLAAELDDAQKIESYTQATILLGYTYRWWPPLQEMKKLLDENAIGKVQNIRMVMSAHLADWHPWEKYQDFFMAQAELGGGALLDESHFIDLLLWMFGMPKSVFANVEKIGELEISTDDNVDLIARYEKGLRANVHLDLLGRPHEKYIHIVGGKGSLHWSFDPNELVVTQDEKSETKKYNHERNDMFIGVAEEFLQCINENKQPSCTITDGINVLQVIEAARKSSETNKEISI
ncbi:MAG: dehydrogenase [Parcubacteria group bacterium]|nr:dehydrogenase [Parcubacteria group bacterium]|tara:strand:- start:902 stop:1879 length:978 start_codon:yes stop_codon:yes gene_type:complete